MNRVIFLMVVTVILLLSMPLVQSFLPSYAMYLIYSTLLVVSTKQFIKTKIFIVWGTWFAYSIFLFLIGHSNSNFGNIIDDLFFLSTPILYIKFRNHFKIHNINKYVDVIFSLNYLYNGVALIILPEFLELYNYVDSEMFRSLNLSNTNFVVFAFFHLIISLYRKIKLNHSGKLLYFTILSAVFYILLSGKATFIILSLLFYVFLIIRNTVKFSLRTFIITPLIAASIFILISIVLDTSDRFSERFESVINLDMSSPHFQRINLNILSLNTFIKNPIFGVGYDFIEIKGNLDNVYNIGIGMHSELVDWLPRYGVLGFLFLSIYFICISKHSYYSNVPGWNFFLITFFVTSIFTNTFSIGVGFLLFIYVPLNIYAGKDI